MSRTTKASAEPYSNKQVFRQAHYMTDPELNELPDEQVLNLDWSQQELPRIKQLLANRAHAKRNVFVGIAVFFMVTFLPGGVAALTVSSFVGFQTAVTVFWIWFIGFSVSFLVTFCLYFYFQSIDGTVKQAVVDRLGSNAYSSGSLNAPLALLDLPLPA